MAGRFAVDQRSESQPHLRCGGGGDNHKSGKARTIDLSPQAAALFDEWFTRSRAMASCSRKSPVATSTPAT